LINRKGSVHALHTYESLSSPMRGIHSPGKDRKDDTSSIVFLDNPVEDLPGEMKMPTGMEWKQMSVLV